MAVKAPIMIMISFSFYVALLFLLSSPMLSLHALDVSSACPHLLTSSNIKSYKRPSNDTLLVIVPWKVGFEQFVHFNPDTCFIDGFSIQVFLQALRHMQPQNPFPYQFVLHGDGKQTPSYDQMIDMVVEGDVDAVVADVTITKERMEKVGFTMPYLASNLVMVTPFRYGSAGTLWDFLKPFSIPLWFTLFATFVFTGAALYLLENKNPDFAIVPQKPAAAPSRDPRSLGRSSSPAHPALPPATEASAAQTTEATTFASASSLSMPGTHSRQTSSFSSLGAQSRQTEFFTSTPAQGALSGQINSPYLPSTNPFSLQRPGPPIYDQASHKRRILNAYWFTSLCVFAAQQESVRTHLGRFVTVMWLFVMLIFNSSYTASLASLLSAQKRYPTIEGFQALVSDKNISVGYPAGSFMSDYVLNKIHIEQDRLKIITSEASYVIALKEGNGKPDGVGAVLDESPYIQILLQSDCFFTKGPADDDLPSWGGFAFAFRKNSSIIEEFSKMIVAMQEDETLKRLQNGWGIGGTKSNSCNSTEEPSHLRLRSFGGLFCVLGGAYVFSIVWRLLTKAVQSNVEICINVLACARNGCNICQGVFLSRRLSSINHANFEHNDAGLEHNDVSLEHTQG